MKRALIIAVSLGLVLAGCASGSRVGDENILDFEERQQTSPSPTPTKTATKQPSPTPTATKSSAAPKQQFCPKQPYRIKIENIGDGFEPQDLRVIKGCKVIFTNKDPDRKHSWVSGTGADPSNDGKLWRSPVLAPGKSWTWTVDAPANPPGEVYQCHDGEVPYILCNLQVVEVK